MIRIGLNIALLGLIFLFVGSRSGQAQETLSLSIREAQNYAVENNYDLRQARLNIKASDKQRWEVTASGFPQISISAQYQNLIDIPTQLIPGEIFGGEAGSTIPVRFGKPHNATYGISVSQLIFSGSYIIGLQASKIYRQLSEQSHQSTELDVRETVAQTCHLILLAEENRRILQSSLENLLQTKSEIGALQEEGFVEETDVIQLQISVAGLENSLSSLDKQTDLAYQLLKMQLGLPFETTLRIKDKLSDLLMNLDIQRCLEPNFQLQKSIQYQLMLTREELAELAMKNEMTGFLPTLAAFASAQRNAQRDEFNLFDSKEKWYPTTVVGLQLQWPIFNGGQKIFRIQKSKVELQLAEVQRLQAAQGLEIEFNRTRAELITANKKFQNDKKTKELAKDVYQINLTKYMEGLVSSLDLIQTHNQYLQSESEYMMSASSLLNAQNKMDKLLTNY